jgi:hypothetical protein
VAAAEADVAAAVGVGNGLLVVGVADVLVVGVADVLVVGVADVLVVGLLVGDDDLVAVGDEDR